MAKVLGTTQSGVLVEMPANDVKKISGDPNIGIGDEFTVSEIYDKLVWITNNIAKIRTLATKSRDFGDQMDAAADAAGV